MKVNLTTLPSPIAEGGEGFIYEVNGQILKVYKKNVEIKEKEQKINLLLKKQLPKTVIGPKEMLYNQKGEFIGYVMEKAKGEELKKLSNKKFVQLHNLKVKDIMELLKKVKETLKTLHQQDIVIGDLNECNILFDENKAIYWLDSDSWKVDKYPCTVCMETFKDPLLHQHHFSKETDYYAFAVLVFKTLTRLHPFGGTTNPEMDIIQRMKKGISVIDKKEIKLPKNIRMWNFFSPELKESVKMILEEKKRFLLDKELDDFYDHLIYCKKHEDDYFSAFNRCPVCEKHAEVIKKPKKIETKQGIPFVCLLTGDEIKWVMDEISYINHQNKLIHFFTKEEFTLSRNEKVYFAPNGSFYVKDKEQEFVVIKGKQQYTFQKQFKSKIEIKENRIYFVSPNQCLIELRVDEKGNGKKTIANVSLNHHYKINNQNQYCIINQYKDKVIIHHNGYFNEWIVKHSIEDVSIHFDEITKEWLTIIHYRDGTDTTMVLDNGKILFQNDQIRYVNGSKNIAFSNRTIFKPGDGVIRGFQYQKNEYKDFEVACVKEDSMLIRKEKTFIVINEKEIYKVG